MIDNHFVVIATLYIIFSVIIMLATIMDVVRSRKLSIMNMCRVMYGITLCIVPALILIGYISGLRVTSGIKYEENLVWTFYAQYVLTVVGYLFLQFGYRIKQKEAHECKISGGQRELLISVIYSVLSMIALYLWASGYGGIDELVANANQIRAGRLNPTNSFTFFKHFVPVSLLASWMLFYVLVKREIHSIIKYLGAAFLLLCNVAISSIYIQANDGRMLLAVYVFLFFLIYFKHQYETKNNSIMSIMLKFGFVFLLVVFILFNADAILHIMKNENYEGVSETNILSTVSREFSFIISGSQNGMVHIFSNDSKLMIGNDLVNGLFAWLPTSLKPVILEDVWDYNTRLLSTGGYGQSPTSIVAQSIYDLSLIGIFIIPFMYGIIIKKVERVLEKRKGNVFFETVYVVIGFYLCKGIPYFSIYNIMINTFFVFVAVLIYNTLQKLKIKIM